MDLVAVSRSTTCSSTSELGHNRLMNQQRRLRSSSTNRRSLPYRLRGPLLSRGELFFFLTLRRAVAGGYIITFKVRLADLVTCDVADWDAGFGHMIARHHLDFVLCDRETTEVLLAIELDDRSHRKLARKRRDRFVTAALKAAGIPLLRVRAAARYDSQVLDRKIAASISKLKPTRAPAPTRLR